MKNRFVELDSLRGIAVVIVMLSHYTWAYDFHYKILGEHKFHFPYGDYGVQIFFVISGFVIFMTLEHTKSALHFIANRFVRLYPTYWVALVVTSLTILLFPTPTLNQVTTFNFLVNLTMIQGIFHVKHIDQVYWSLQIELIFYMIMSVLFFAKKLKYIEFFSVLWLILSAISIFFDFDPYEKFFRVLLISYYAPLFIAGIMFYKIKFKEHTVYNHIIVLCSFIVYLFLVHLNTVVEHPDGNEIIRYLLVFALYVTFYLIIYFDLKFLKNRPLLFIGEISYPLYLLHNVIGYALIYRLKKVWNNQFFYSLVSSIVAILLAYVVLKLMEQPTRKIKVKLNNFINIGLPKFKNYT